MQQSVCLRCCSTSALAFRLHLRYHVNNGGSFLSVCEFINSVYANGCSIGFVDIT